MKTVWALATCAAIISGAGGAAFADPGKDESGKGRGRGEYRDDYRRQQAREYKEEFRQGDCKVERKWERDGGYKEEVKCDGKRR